MTECSYCRCTRAALKIYGKEKDKKDEKLDLRYCPRCNHVAYCSRQCQRAHWNYHKKYCSAANCKDIVGDIKRWLGPVDLVLHCSVISSRIHPTINSLMGVYSPDGCTDEGLPIWRRYETLSYQISQKFQECFPRNMDGTQDSNLVLQTLQTDENNVLSLSHSEQESGTVSWKISSKLGILLRSVQSPTEEVLRLFKERWDQPNYFHSHQPLFQILTNSTYSHWEINLQSPTFQMGSVSVSIIPAIFVTKWLNIDYTPPIQKAMSLTTDEIITPKKKKKRKKKNTVAETAITVTTDASFVPQKSLMELWMRNIVLDIGIMDRNNGAVGNVHSCYSQLFSIPKRFSAVYSPKAQKGEYPIWKKISPLQDINVGGGEEEQKDSEIYLYVDEKTKCWVVRNGFPDHHEQYKQSTANDNILLQSQSPISAKDEELALVAYNEERSKDSIALGQLQQRLLTSSLWTVNISDRYQQQVEVWLSPLTIWDSSKASSCLSLDSFQGGTAFTRVSMCSKEFATQAFSRISSAFNLKRVEGGGGEAHLDFSAHWMGRHLNEYSIKELVLALFCIGPCNWVQVNDSVTSPIILEISLNRRNEFGLLNFDFMFAKICYEKRIKDMTALVSSNGVNITPDLLCETVFRDLPKATTNQFANKLALEIKTVLLKSKADYKRVIEIATGKLGKGPHKNLLFALNRGLEALKTSSISCKSSSNLQFPHSALESDDVENEGRGSSESIDENKTSLIVPKRFEKLHSKIDSLILWYEQELLDCKIIDEGVTRMTSSDDDNSSETSVEEDEKAIDSRSPSRIPALTGEELSIKLDEFSRISDGVEQDKFIATVERQVDLKTWEGSVELPILITEQAHKWFQRRVKKHMRLCERVMRRLRLLATGRRSYVLCKPLRTNNSSIRLYESKIDAARRIIWEDALTFSPRCSMGGSYFAETGVRVWEIVEDHDNLSRAIQLTIDRIEKSHARGLRCMLFTELIDEGNLHINCSNTQQDVTPSRYPIQENIRCEPKTSEDNKSLRLNHPANEDEKQYNLLKFYELNYEFVKVILDKEDSQADLPFVPGPRECEIINYTPEPKNSLLLMGRSGTGKTTCLVYRMWSRFLAYQKAERRPNMLFMTKSEMLKAEVEKSFQNMGLVLAHKSEKFNSYPSREHEQSNPMFVTSSEWLDVLDAYLPGERFFTKKEAKYRAAFRLGGDLRRTVESLLGQDCELDQDELNREEMTYLEFRKLWPKVNNSKPKSKIDPALVWMEIKSYIKGSLEALQLESDERDDPMHRFLSEAEYLSLGKKRSRLDEGQRKEVYHFYLKYEKLKKVENRYDEMDIVYNLVGRLAKMQDFTEITTCPLLDIDCAFVDEVQDFTIAELYLLTKLSRDPDNLMLAGDTAQTIALGVGFRFTDVRQVFFEKFGSKKPELLLLFHNYRSHAGVLRLAASVLDLLYTYFPLSLDVMPPDQGLFDGPKPVIMDISDLSELVLILEGSKRETARIEFGAHQVVIVRSEIAKEKVCQQYNIDKEWIMTVQQCKGLEFDDVLLYNFFTDSDASDMWRVFAGYSKEDMETLHSKMEKENSRLGHFSHYGGDHAWDDKLDLLHTRPLPFDGEKHKLLENELKMLYTAITRARVNVFFAESDVNGVCRPVFNYFMRRQVVDDVKKALQDKNENLRVFGNASTTEDWQKQGEIYLQKANGDQAKRMLNLAMKCFENAGNTKRKDYTKAYLSFIEAAESFDFGIMGNRTKRNDPSKTEEMYKIAFQLLETQDEALLHLAAECLIKIGDYEFIHGARALELYARLSYAQSKRAKVMAKKYHTPAAPTPREQSHFELAAKLYAKLMTDSKQSIRIYRTHVVNVVRNYLSTGLEEFIMAAADLVECNTEHYLYIFNEFHSIFTLTPSVQQYLRLDPLSYLCYLIGENRVECSDFIEAFSKISLKACMHYYRKSDQEGFRKALNSLVEAERIVMLLSLEEDVNNVIRSCPWSDHPAFLASDAETQFRPRSQKSKINLSKFVVDELSKIGDFKQAGKFLERRGEFLAAASNYDKISGVDESFTLLKSFNCRVRHVELTLKSCDSSDLNSLKQYLKPPPGLSCVLIPMETKASVMLSSFALEHSRNDFFWKTLVATVSGSILWQLEGLKCLVKLYQFDGLMNNSNCLGGNFLQRSCSYSASVNGVFPFIKALLQPVSHRNEQQRRLVAQVESFFELHVDNNSAPQVSTNMICNLRLREALLLERMELSTLTRLGSLDTFVLVLDRCKLHQAAAQYLAHVGIHTLFQFDKWLAAQSRNTLVETIQARIICTVGLQNLCRYHSIVQCRPWWLNEYVMHANLAKQESLSLALRVIKGPQVFINTAGSLSDILWLPDFLSTLKQECLKDVNHTEMDQRRVDIDTTIILWRLEFLASNHTFASRTLEDYFSKIEKSDGVKLDIRKNKTDHFLPQRGKMKPEAAISIGRLWCWAVDYVYGVKPDFFMSIKLICHLQWKINSSTYLKSMDVDLQLSLIEANVTVLLSCLSCYYSMANRGKKLWCLLPERSYFECFLMWKHNFYGRPLCEVILSTVTAHLTEFIDAVEDFFQSITSLILDLGILSKQELFKSEEDDFVEQLERVLHLSLIIIINIATFHDILNQSKGTEKSNLPFQLVNNTVLKLTEKSLQAIFTKRIFPHHIQKLIPPTSADTVTVETLSRIFQNILECTRNDKLIFFCLDEYAAITKHPIDGFLSRDPILWKQLLYESDDEIFYNASMNAEKKPVMLMNESCLGGISIVKTFGLLQKIRKDNGIILTLDEVECLSSKVRQNRAASSIQLCWRHQHGYKLEPCMFFQRINVSLAVLQRKIKRSHVVAKHIDQVYLFENPPVDSFISSGNLWIDECLKGAYKCWYQVVNSNKAFMDGIECTYCNVAMLKEDIKNQRQLRLNWCEIHCENKSYYLAAKQYNLQHFGVPFAPFSSASMKKHHERSDVHKNNVEEYNKSFDRRRSDMCKVIALLECSTVMMHKIIIFVRFQQPKQEEEEESSDRSRFINLHDEAFSFHIKLESSFNVLRKAALFWPYPKNFSLLLKEAKKLCEDAHRFFHEKVHQHEKEIIFKN